MPCSCRWILDMFLFFYYLHSHLVGCVEAADGSCIAAGYTECCNSAETGGPCAGAPPVCYCDPSCKKYNDCCSDLDQICRDPAIGNYSNLRARGLNIIIIRGTTPNNRCPINIVVQSARNAVAWLVELIISFFSCVKLTSRTIQGNVAMMHFTSVPSRLTSRCHIISLMKTIVKLLKHLK